MSRNAGDSLAPSNSTAPPIVSSQSIIQTDCSPEPPPKKNSNTKTECAPVFFHIKLFLLGTVLHQKQASALAHAHEEHVESFGRHRQAKLLQFEKTVMFLGFGMLGYN